MSKLPLPVSTPDLDAAVRERYAGAARARETALGRGDPSRHLRAGETVLDLGSGTGKVCLTTAQVGARGRVIRVDMNDEMLALARCAAPTVASRPPPVRSEADLVAREPTVAELGRTRPLVAAGATPGCKPEECC